jgi:hypothetical protein
MTAMLAFILIAVFLLGFFLGRASVEEKRRVASGAVSFGKPGG